MFGKSPRRVVITGASRGLGLEFARQYLAADGEVAALARAPRESEGLCDLAREYPDALSLHVCDVADEASVGRACAEVKERFKGVDLLINNAGIGGDGRKLVELDLSAWSHVFEVNAVGPVRVTRAFLPLLRNGRKTVNALITSRMGSIADNDSGGAWAYRMSKAALNMAGRNMMHGLTYMGIRTYIFHPGWVRTDMGGPQATLAIPDAVTALVATIDRLGRKHNGGFFDLNGEALPW